MPGVVQEIGALAGWAAAVGLAVLAALHVSHARDVKRLREWAGRAPERSRRGATPAPGRAAGAPATTRRAALRGVPAVALVGLLVLGGAATYGVTRLTGDDARDGSGDARANDGDGSAGEPERDAAAVTPGDVTVAVLNGTTVPGLAAMLSDRIAAAGFRKGAIDDYSDKQLVESVVQYAPGREAEAEAVGRSLGLSRLEPVAADSRALAGDATVVVIAGADTAP